MKNEFLLGAQGQEPRGGSGVSTPYFGTYDK